MPPLPLAQPRRCQARHDAIAGPPRGQFKAGELTADEWRAFKDELTVRKRALPNLEVRRAVRRGHRSGDAQPLPVERSAARLGGDDAVLQCHSVRVGVRVAGR